MRLCLLIPILIFTQPLYSQNTVWDSWDPEVVRTLHTAEGIGYLTEEEQKVVLFMNMARHDGPLFASTFLDAYVTENMVKNSSYLRSLKKDLKKTSGLVPFQVEEDLTVVARGHADVSGRTGHVGHKDFNKRFAPLRGNPYTAWAENCSYGYKDAVEIVITLLIDEGVKGVGHRNNILNPGFNSVGVAIFPHKRYKTNCVIDFGDMKRSELNIVPY
ncbi:MAG: CAP domain-containing protein [Bacteroidota bacterium]